MKKSFCMMIVFMLFGFAGCGAPSSVDKNNAAFRDAVQAIAADEIILNDITLFEWDIMYTFAPYTSKENIEEIIGFHSSAVKETVSEGMTQLLFVKGKEVVCSICGYGTDLGYSVSFGAYDGNYLSVKYGDHAVFAVSRSGGTLNLTYIG